MKSLITYGRPWASRYPPDLGQIGTKFIPRYAPPSQSLPDLKRVQASLVELSGIPVVISETHLEQRQRDRLQAQRIPFICSNIQAYLPFMDEEYWSGKPNKQVKIYDPHKWAKLEY